MNDALPINTLARRGHNSAAAPLIEVLDEELEPARRRAADLLGAARDAKIADDTDAGKVADLIALIRDHERGVGRVREARKQPFLADCRVIDRAFGSILEPLARARTDTLSPMLDEWRREHADKPIATAVASVGSRREISFCIEDLPAAVGWLLQSRPGEIAQAARTIIGAALRSRGVNAAPEASIPGVRVEIVTRTQVR